MPRPGTLKTWHDDRGFGFIAPTDGGIELFVHISAFPRDGTRPVLGELLTYEIGSGKDGKPAAVRVFRPATSKRSIYPARQRTKTGSRRPLLALLVVSLLVTAIASYAFTRYKSQVNRRALAEMPANAFVPATLASPGQFHCDGRTHCSQMTSCAEATYFINNCPGTTMDGNNDGTPCEKQWCNTPWSK